MVRDMLRRGAPMLSSKSSLTFILTITSLAVAAVACTSETTAGNANNATTADAGPDGASADTCVADETRCKDGLVQRCNAGTGLFDPPSKCDNPDDTCRENACAPPTDKQLAQAKELASMVTYVQDGTAWHSPIDYDALRAKGRDAIVHGDGSDLTYFTALFDAFIAVPQGHQGLYLTGNGATSCGKLVPYPAVSQRGACGRPHAKGIIVTAAKANNVLGLKKGDIVTGIEGGASGSAILASLAARPICATSRPSTSFRDASTASSFTDLLRSGEVITIESPDGTTRKATIPDGGLSGNLKDAVSCSDPFSRAAPPAESELRPDGVGVIRLPSFVDPEQPFPSGNVTQADLDQYRAAFEAKIKTAFDKVKNAPAIVWDIRGNGGGLTLVGLHIASGMPGAKADQISYCQARIEKTNPPQFDAMKYVPYALTPGGDFAYSGKVAILTEGMNYSAADYFPLAVKTRTSSLLVGAPTAGGFGATSLTQPFKGPPAFSVSIDVNRCSSADTDAPLEGHSVEPHIAVDYDAKDLAAGIDTVLERAVAELKK